MIRINAIEKRASALGLSLLALCRLAGASYSSVQRWRTNPDHNPTMRLYRTTCEALERALAARERELLMHLIGLHPREALEALATRDARPAQAMAEVGG